MAMSGFLMAVSCWRHILQCTVIMQSFLRLLKLHKLAVGKLYLLGGWGGSYSVLDYGLNLQWTTEGFYHGVHLRSVDRLTKITRVSLTEDLKHLKCIIFTVIIPDVFSIHSKGR